MSLGDLLPIRAALSLVNNFDIDLGNFDQNGNAHERLEVGMSLDPMLLKKLSRTHRRCLWCWLKLWRRMGKGGEPLGVSLLLGDVLWFFDHDGCAVDLSGCDCNGDASNMVKVGMSLETDCQSKWHFYHWWLCILRLCFWQILGLPTVVGRPAAPWSHTLIRE